MKLNNEKMEIQISQLKKKYIPLKKWRNNSTIETKFDKNGNNISMLETSNEADEGKVTKEGDKGGLYLSLANPVDTGNYFNWHWKCSTVASSNEFSCG